MDDSGFEFDADDETDGTSKEIWNSRELTVFLIDCTSEMFHKRLYNEVEESYFSLCIRCCKATLMNKIIGTSKDLVAIVLFGTKAKDAGDQNAKGVFTFFEPSQPNSSIIKHLNMILDSPNYADFDFLYGHTDDFSIADALWHCSSLITKYPLKINISTIILMTCNDNPHNGDVSKQFQLKKRASDLESLHITLQLVPFGEQFCVSLFYEDLLKLSMKQGSKSCDVIPIKSLEELLERVNRKDYKKRSVGKINFHLGEGVTIAVAIYNTYRSLSIPSATKLDGTTNEPLKSVSQLYHGETGEKLLHSDINKYCVFGEERIRFTNDEMLKLSNIGEVGLTLFGFKSTSYLYVDLHSSPASFLYPVEKRVNGGSLLFKTLLEQCIKRNKLALGCLISRYKGRPSIVCLLAQKEKLDAYGNQLLPSGFHMIYIPYAESIRDIHIEPISVVKDKQRDIVKRIVKKLLISYKPKKFENPKIQIHWASVEALALNSLERREVFDDISPDYDYVSSRLGNLEQDFQRLFYSPQGYDPLQPKINKRPSSFSSNTGRTKNRKLDTTTEAGPSSVSNVSKVKMPKLVDNSDTMSIQKAAKDGDLKQFTVPALKNFLRDCGVSTTGYNKTNLIDTIYFRLGLPNPDG